jgi:hypothetical protein
MKYKKLTSLPEFEINPFVEKAIEDIKVVKRMQVVRPADKNEIQMIVNQSGEVEGHTAFLRHIEIDEEKFAKVYLSNFAAFWELSKPAIRVFGYVLSMLKPNEDNFIFDLDDCVKFTKYTHKNSVMSGLSTLIECGIIARSNKHYRYFINPLVIFNGSRVTFAKSYVIKKEKLPSAFDEIRHKNNELHVSDIGVFS